MEWRNTQLNVKTWQASHQGYRPASVFMSALLLRVVARCFGLETSRFHRGEVLADGPAGHRLTADIATPDFPILDEPVNRPLGDGEKCLGVLDAQQHFNSEGEVSYLVHPFQLSLGASSTPRKAGPFQWEANVDRKPKTQNAGQPQGQPATSRCSTCSWVLSSNPGRLF